jgi:2-polyprenyl-3-methyl-5-hydroxy-6-metoxy-1,4-benzoquinol methylase/tetratricopeptide (TPR) repeat protein
MTSDVRDEQSIRRVLQEGMAHHDAGRFAEAESAYRRVLSAVPHRPDALVLLGALAHGRGNLETAVAAYRRAAAHAPGFLPAWINLANALEEQGRFDEALGAHRAALAIDERPELRARLAHCAEHSAHLPADAAFRGLVTRALAEAWVRPSELALTAIRLLRADPALADATDAAVAPSALAALSGHALLLALLESAQVCEPHLERFLALARRALLDRAVDPDSAATLAFACALARQCFLNDYVFAAPAEELARAASLRDTLGAAIARAGAISPSALAAVAAYFPLGSLPAAERLLERAWPEPVARLLVEHLEDPRTERALREAIPAWTPVAHEVSQRVRRQYEESPYPRWVRCPSAEALPLAGYLQRLFPEAVFDPPIPGGAIEVLVAGCGTGQEPVALARELADARICAIDLSRVSLAYAMRKTRELRLPVEYAQADIVELGSLGRSFDVISSAGVLHHLADPEAGWRTLAGMLRPGGFMRVGLYSELGRRDLASARRLIAERGYEATPEGIRACRRELLDSGRFPRLAALRDLYGLNECRDLLFHVEEHRFDLPQVARMVAALGLQLMGLLVEPAVRRRFRARFPEGDSDVDLSRWHAFEQDNPDTFSGMYLFWVRKPPAE